MNDLLTGADSEEEVLQIQKDVIKILEEAGFQLRKRLCNKKDILAKFKIIKELQVSIQHRPK